MTQPVLALVVLMGAYAGVLAAPVQFRTVLQGGDGGSHSYRIPCLATAADGSLILVAEARRVSWKDKTRTDLIVTLSSDAGATWSTPRLLTESKGEAYMDPCIAVDAKSGRISLFTTRWPTKDHSTKGNTLWLLTSTDHGQTWSKPTDITTQFLPPGFRPSGTGPGAGIQLLSGPKAGRLLVALRGRPGGKPQSVALMSDDGGVTWKTGGNTSLTSDDELQVAEIGPGILMSNRRAHQMRHSAVSRDSGQSWTPEKPRPELLTLANGCHAATFTAGKSILYTSPAGADARKGFDNRGRLTLLRSTDAGATWTEKAQLNELAAGYSCMTRLKDGRVAIVFETSDTPSFILNAERSRWMRLDVGVLPAAVSDPSIPLSRTIPAR
ncbi:MAG: sialidase family protein [Opitutales bacterium]